MANGCDCLIRTVALCAYGAVYLKIKRGEEMYWETLPDWVWIIYYFFIIATLGFAIFSIIQKKMIILSTITIVLTITIPISNIINSIGREKGVDEFEHLVTHLQQGSPWSIYAIIGFLYLLVWWVLLLIKNKKKAIRY
ncbi:hypothetical protein [Lysinibacillus sp. TE18511]